MASIARMGTSKRPPRRRSPIPTLEAGDLLDQPTFHARYEAMPDVRAELIGGIVYMSSPLKPQHGRTTAHLSGWLTGYERETPGTEAYDNTTVILGPRGEVQSDGFLILSPGRGGATRLDAAGFLTGPPEFLSEVATSTESYDLHAKKDEYERAGVKEYLAVALRQAQVLWFVRRRGKFQALAPGADGILRSTVFPGLWLDPQALLKLDSRRISEVLRAGLASPEHAAFLNRLAGK